ncbi:hypothetical protein IA759_01165 [Listeria marthii]|nr:MULTISPECIES: hypothetical protein [Listeria]MBF2361818.1 hypothetical protein [Listeria marthii]MBF2477716.1 hypothetical protein [Listeria marthii]MBF2494349.1 hypothetical protein [Listeria marthii]MBF2513536.1 hypothetical protein [Listeria marthii]MBF2516272.1 hypothetical protein [Listeria marthii]
MKAVVNDAFSVFGMVFVFLLIVSYFLPIGEIVENGRVFLLVFFVLNIVGRYFLTQKKENNKFH